MIFVRYDRNRLILAALAMLGCAWLSSAGAGASGDLGMDTLATLMFVIFVCAASRLGYLASGDLAALKEEGDALIVNGLWWRRRVSWRNFGGVAIRGVRILWLPIPFFSFNHVMVRRADAGLIGHPKFPLLLADVPSGRIATLSQQLDTLALERGAHGGFDQTPASPGGDFNPDDAIARYLARKQEAETEGAAPAAPVRPAPIARPQAPVRAGFGRKGL